MKNNKSLVLAVVICILVSGINTVVINLVMNSRNNGISITDDKMPGAGINQADEYTFNAKDFGVVGDGNTDDTAALQALINSVSESGGGTINLPRGTYKTKGIVLKDYVRLVGEGGQNFSTKIINSSPSPAITMYTYSQLEHLCVYGNSYYTGNYDSGTGILLDGSYSDGCQNVLINDVSVSFNGGYGIDFYGGVWVIDIVNSVISKNKLTGIRIDSTNGTVNSGQKNAINIDKCNISNNGQDGLFLLGTVINVRDCRIEDNKLAGISFDYSKAVNPKRDLFAKRINIDGNYSEGHSLAFIYGKLGHTSDGYYHAINWLTIANNYSATVGQPGVQIINEGTNVYGISQLYYSNNMFNGQGEAKQKVYADFGNVLSENSIILDNDKRIINKGWARTQ